MPDKKWHAGMPSHIVRKGPQSFAHCVVLPPDVPSCSVYRSKGCKKIEFVCYFPRGRFLNEQVKWRAFFLLITNFLQHKI